MQRRDCLRGLLALAALSVAPPGLAGDDEGAPVGRVRDLHHGVWLDAGTLVERLAAATAIVVGERHDNPEHQRLERWLIARLAERGVLGGVAMEMLEDRQSVRRAQVASPRPWRLDDAALRQALAWRDGWDWSAYGPVVREALRRGVPLAAANLPRPRIREIVDEGRPPALPAAVATAQRRALIEGHCGLLPDGMLDGLLAAQVARDRAMAAALADLPALALLICGSGHARRDVGVALHAGEKPLCVGLVEVAPGQAWHAALPASVDPGPPFDLAWFTLPVPGRHDPCAELRERFAAPG